MSEAFKSAEENAALMAALVELGLAEVPMQDWSPDANASGPMGGRASVALPGGLGGFAMIDENEELEDLNFPQRRGSDAPSLVEDSMRRDSSDFGSTQSEFWDSGGASTGGGNAHEREITRRVELLKNTLSLAKTGTVEPQQLVERLKGYRGEDNGKVWVELSSSLSQVGRVIKSSFNTDVSAAFEEFASTLILPAFAQVGWDAVEGDDKNRKLLRATLAPILAKFCSKDPEVAAEAARRCAVFFGAPRDEVLLSTDIRPAVLVIAMQGSNAADVFEKLIHAHGAVSDGSAKADIYAALGSAPSVALQVRALDWTLTDAVSVQDMQAIPMAVAESRKEGAQCVFDWIKQNFDKLIEKMGASSFLTLPHLVKASGIGFATEEEAQQVKEFWESKPEVMKSVQRSVRQVVEGIRTNAKFAAVLAAADMPSIEWLDAAASPRLSDPLDSKALEERLVDTKVLEERLQLLAAGAGETGTKSPNPGKQVLRPCPTWPKRKVRLLLVLGALRMARYLLRPCSAPILVILAVCLRRRRPIFATICGASGLREFWSLMRDPIILRAAGINKAGPSAGLHYLQGSLMSQILKVAELETVAGLKPPSWLWNGDLSTLWTLQYIVPRPDYRRLRLALGPTRAPISVDVAMPSTPQVTGAIIIAAGVGGDSEAPYVRHLAAAASREGYVVVALIPRGLGAKCRVADVHDFFDPTDFESLDLAVRRICDTLQLDTYMVGYSLGACMLGGYFAKFEPPARVLGGVAVCGAIRNDFIDWWRYRDLYQPCLVPGIVSRMLDTYGEELAGMLSDVELSAMAGCRTYKDFHRNFGVKVGATQDYDEWRLGSMALDPKKISRPFLLFACLDDPLHDPERIGVQLPVDNANVAMYFVASGGHVASPTGASPSGYPVLTNIALRFCAGVREATASGV